MAKREHITLKTKLAAALRELGGVPYEHAKQMTADQIISLFHFDHGILHAVEPIDDHWNLTPRLIAAHREKSRRDTTVVAKVMSLERSHEEFRARALAVEKRPAPASRWPKRKLRGRGWSKRST